MDSLKTILITDCGSTTTKAILIERKGDTYRQTFRGERFRAPSQGDGDIEIAHYPDLRFSRHA